MRKGEGHPDFPVKEPVGLLAYLDRVARGLGLITEDVQAPGQRAARGRDGSFEERLDRIFRKTREPGEDDEA